MTTMLFLQAHDQAVTGLSLHATGDFLMSTSLQQPVFFVPTMCQFMHFTLIETSLQCPPLYNVQLIMSRVAIVEWFNCILKHKIMEQ